MSEFRLETPRLILRDWREEDIDPFHAICSDPVVMATLGPLMSRSEVAALVARMYRMQVELGHCFWAMERKADAQLIGWCGIIRGRPGTSIDGKPEAGWRMTPSAWGKGYVTEAANASVQWAFDTLPDDAVWAITNTDNRRSRAVMERIGMVRDPSLDFDHPQVPRDSPLLSHVTYRMGRGEWAGNRTKG
ncbi:GNAT family N-acetyltransferase [Sphingorhabdus sp.]|uniref:GNAT family N-acetyltransferase n=1 Tax=Sphingorhabdus sp. TaxID=1902408 RepID=UPI0035B0A556|nr:GNAT family N-acetyltransferase [Sphingomonadaceae bacterium]